MECLPFHSKAGIFLFQNLCPSLLKPCFPVPNSFVRTQTFILTEDQRMVYALLCYAHCLLLHLMSFHRSWSNFNGETIHYATGKSAANDICGLDYSCPSPLFLRMTHTLFLMTLFLCFMFLV